MKFVTSIVTLLLAGAIGFIALQILPPFTILRIMFVSLLLIIFLAILAISYLMRPVGYVLTEKQLIIKRPWKDVMIDFSNIIDATIVWPVAMHWKLEKNGGNAGFFGYCGKFTTVFGHTTFYATRLDNLVMIRTIDGDQIMLSPDDLELAMEIRERLFNAFFNNGKNFPMTPAS